MADEDFDDILRRAALPDAQPAEQPAFDYDDWLAKLNTTGAQADPDRPTVMIHPPAAAVEQSDTEGDQATSSPSVQVFAPAPPAAARPQEPPLDLSEGEAPMASPQSRLIQLETELAGEREARRLQQQALVSAHRQLDYASAELARSHQNRDTLESEASEFKATEQAQRIQLREESVRSTRDGAVIRSLQQREASLLAQLSGALQERDTASAAATSHRRDAESLRRDCAELHRLQLEDRRMLQRLKRENSHLLHVAETSKAQMEAAVAKMTQQSAQQAAAQQQAAQAQQQAQYDRQDRAHAARFQEPLVQDPFVMGAPAPPPPEARAAPSSPAYRVASYATPAVPSSPPPPLPPPPGQLAQAPAPVASAKRQLLQEFAPQPRPQPPAPIPVASLPPAVPPPPMLPGPPTPPRVAPAMAPHTAGLPVAAKHRATRRAVPNARERSFNLLSGEATDEATGATPRASHLVWEKGVAFIAPTRNVQALPVAPPYVPPPAAAPAQPSVPAPPWAHAPLPPSIPELSASQDAVPFAIDDDVSRRATEAIAPLEKELLSLSMQKDRLDAEYARMPISAGRTAAERRSKALCEERLNEIAQRMGALRLKLKTLQPMRR